MFKVWFSHSLSLSISISICLLSNAPTHTIKFYPAKFHKVGIITFVHNYSIRVKLCLLPRGVSCIFYCSHDLSLEKPIVPLNDARLMEMLLYKGVLILVQPELKIYIVNEAMKHIFDGLVYVISLFVQIFPYWVLRKQL